MKTKTKCIGARYFATHKSKGGIFLHETDSGSPFETVIVIKESDLQRQIAVMLKAIYVLKRCPQSQEDERLIIKEIDCQQKTL